MSHSNRAMVFDHFSLFESCLCHLGCSQRLNDDKIMQYEQVWSMHVRHVSYDWALLKSLWTLCCFIENLSQPGLLNFLDSLRNSTTWHLIPTNKYAHWKMIAFWAQMCGFISQLIKIDGFLKGEIYHVVSVFFPRKLFIVGYFVASSYLRKLKNSLFKSGPFCVKEEHHLANRLLLD